MTFLPFAEDISLARGKVYAGPGLSASQLRKAKAAHDCDDICGSDDKEIVDSVGAEVSSSEELVKKGMVDLGAPAEKRLGLNQSGL